ncbi:MAG: hypothetical protein KBB54_00045 [Candidatus Pacebacteria bacterium]|nr:hypothetical protein [Candidatus Paceibacterota bacterium]MBP9818619.1 hypothetical protein [Candidatus Paceibacterota bacterium]
MTNKKSKSATSGSSASTASIAIIGGLVAAAAGAYFIHGNKAAQRKIKQVKGWALKAKGEVLERIEKIKEVDENLYQQAIDAVMKKYEGVKSIDTTELSAVAKELKSHWKNIKRELNAGKKVAKKTVAKAKKATVKVAEDAVKAVKK